VKDSGHGIDPTIADRIFDPYFTTKQVGEGSGMGLAVVHGIVKSHGGDISVKSEKGKGTAFYVLIPCVDKAADVEVQAASNLPMGNESILLVDDEKTMVHVIQPMLERLGYQVTARTSSVEALEAFRANPGRFDMVITDYTMPNMTGMELAHKLMQIEPEIPIILCTGYSAQINKEKAKKMGIKAFVMKPIVMNELAEIIRKVFDH
jgi:CheY-like chemotaxis protein